MSNRYVEHLKLILYVYYNWKIQTLFKKKLEKKMEQKKKSSKRELSGAFKNNENMNKSNEK